MKITFVLPSTGISGGAKAVFEFANHLKDRGHNVSIIYPLIPLCSGPNGYDIRSWKNRVKGTIGNFIQGVRVDWFDLRAKLIRVPTLAQKYIPEADIVVATWWETAYYVNKYSKKKGEKFYLAQHYEIWGGPKEKVNNSYKLGLRIIVNSTWLKNILHAELNAKIETLILHAPDWEQFYPENRKENTDIIRLLMIHRRENWKGSKDGIEAFKIVREKFPNIQLVMVGPEPAKDVPGCAEYHKRPSNSELRQIYNSCDIFIFPSWYEGFGMPPMEAMACKCAVVTTNVGAIPDYTIPDKTALVSQPRDIKALAQNIIELIKDETKRKRIAENGYNYIKQFTWRKATDELEAIFLKHIKTEIQHNQ